MYYYIINPASGFGKISKIQERLKSRLDDLGIVGEFVKTTGRGDATKLTKLALSKGYGTIVAVGGDNTVNEVINGLVDSRACLGVIPIGSNNSLAKTLGIWNWEQAPSILAARKLETIDLARLNNRYFITTAAVGFETNIIRKRAERGFWPKLLFGQKILTELKNFSPQQAKITFEGRLLADTEIFTIIVANSKPLSGFKKTFRPNPQDGILDILIVSGLSKLKVFVAIPSIIRGSYENLPQTSIFRTKKLKIQTKDPLPVSADGEEIDKTPTEIEIVPKKLKAIVGKERQF